MLSYTIIETLRRILYAIQKLGKRLAGSLVRRILVWFRHISHVLRLRRGRTGAPKRSEEDTGSQSYLGRLGTETHFHSIGEANLFPHSHSEEDRCSQRSLGLRNDHTTSNHSFTAVEPYTAASAIPSDPDSIPVGENQPHSPNAPYAFQMQPMYSSSCTDVVGVADAVQPATPFEQLTTSGLQNTGSSESHSMLSDANPMFVPISPEALTRYEKREMISEDSIKCIIPPLTFKYDTRERSPEWEVFQHPEGCQYFYNTKMHIYTDTDLYKRDNVEAASEFIKSLCDWTNKIGFDLSDDIDIVMDIYPYEDRGMMCCYYLVNHAKKLIFWLDDFDAENFVGWGQLKGVKTLSHVGLLSGALYWRHCELFPHSREISISDIDECRSHLLFAIADEMTSPTSTVNATREEMEVHLKLLETMQMSDATRQSTGTTLALGRLMNNIELNRFFHFYGERSARLNYNESVYRHRARNPSWLYYLSTSVLFRVPDIYLEALKTIYVDGLVSKRRRRLLIGKLISEWQELTIIATVILNANVAFLAINDVQIGSVNGSRSVTQILSYLSAVASLSTIIGGLLLIRLHKNKGDYVDYILLRIQEYLGSSFLATAYGLPYAVLLWSMLLFTAAFLCLCFVQTTNLVRALVGTLCLVMALCVLPYIWMPWETFGPIQLVSRLDEKIGFFGMRSGAGTVARDSNRRTPTSVRRKAYFWRRLIWKGNPSQPEPQSQSIRPGDGRDEGQRVEV